LGASTSEADEMSDYYSLPAIARRLGVSRNTVLSWHLRLGLLMYRRRVGPRWVWYTNDSLLTSWELARCKLDYQRRWKPPRP